MRTRLRVLAVAAALLTGLLPTQLVPIAQAQTCPNHTYTVQWQIWYFEPSDASWNLINWGQYRIDGTMCYNAGVVTEVRSPTVTRVAGNEFPGGYSRFGAIGGGGAYGRQGLIGTYKPPFCGSKLTWSPYQQITGSGTFTVNPATTATLCGNYIRGTTVSKT